MAASTAWGTGPLPSSFVEDSSGRQYGVLSRALTGALLLLLISALACGSGVETGAPATGVAPEQENLAEPTPAPFPPAPGQPDDTGTYPPAFVDVTGEAGVVFLHHEHPDELMGIGAGALVLDFNGDGLDDIYVVDSFGPNVLYHNNGDGTFDDVAVAAGVDDPQGRGSGGCAADHDNDGDQDLFVTNYGASKLFSNNGDGTFADVTAAANVSDPDETHRSTGCAWGDYDQDGHLDLIVVRHMHEWSPDMLARLEFQQGVRRLSLYHSNGDGTFTDVVSLLGATDKADTQGEYGPTWGAGFQPGWADFDNDGDLDLYVVNDFGKHTNANVLWRNDGPAEDGSWRFSDVSAESRADVAMNGMALAVGDYDLDGYLDMFMTNIRENVLLRNRGRGLQFTDVASKAGAAVGYIGQEQRVSWGAAFFDYDNDGDEDLYVVSGFLKYSLRPLKEQPNVLLRNEHDGTFTDVSFGSGVDDSRYGRGGAYLDFDNDGCLDLFVANLDQKAALFRNLCEWGNTWLVVDLEGTASNRDGVGARITVVTGGSAQIREVNGGSSQMGQNMMSPHFGLGVANRADSVVIRWPSGAVQTLVDVPANQRLTVTEPE